LAGAGLCAAGIEGSSEARRRFGINAINDYIAPVSSITIRNLDSSLKEKLRVRAAEHGHSMEGRGQADSAACPHRRPAAAAAQSCPLRETRRR
jgi:hypothetical protein